MTFEKLAILVEEHNIPKDVILESDSGWECGPTDVNGVYYSAKQNKIMFTQRCDIYQHPYHESEEWKALTSGGFNV